MSTDSPSSLSVPQLVRGDVARLHAATGHLPSLTELGRRHWRLELANDRMQLIFQYRANGRGVLALARSTLLVGGVRRPVPKTLYPVATAFHGVGDGEAFPRRDPTPILTGADLGDAPPSVQTYYRRMDARMPDTVGVTLGTVEDIGWVIGIGGPKGGLRLFFARTAHGVWQVDIGYGLQVVADGQDLSAQATGKIQKAVDLLAQDRTSPAAAASTGSAIAGTAGAKATTSTQVRNTVVMRN